MNARLSHRCTALLDRAREAWLSQPLAQKLSARKAVGRRRMTMELLDMQLYRIDIGG